MAFAAAEDEVPGIPPGYYPTPRDPADLWRWSPDSRQLQRCRGLLWHSTRHLSPMEDHWRRRNARSEPMVPAGTSCDTSRRGRRLSDRHPGGNPVAMAAGRAQWPNVFNRILPGPGAANGNIRRPTQPLCHRSTLPFKGIQYRLHFWFAFTATEEIRSSDGIDPKSMEHSGHCTNCYWNAASTLAHRAMEVDSCPPHITEAVLSEAAGLIEACARGGLQPLSGRVA